MGILKYKITIEPIEEPNDILRQRIKKLWSECDNHHNWVILRSEAERLGFELDFKDLPR